MTSTTYSMFNGIKRESVICSSNQTTGDDNNRTSDVTGAGDKEEYSTTKVVTVKQESINADAKELDDQMRSDTNSMNTAAQRQRIRRVPRTCNYCDTGEDRKNQHICHVSDCNKVFRTPSRLRAHIRLHMGERPYTCNWDNCGKRFARTDELQRHRRSHTGEKRYECNVCDKKFGRSDHLSKHMRMHNKVKCEHNDSGSNHSGTSDSNK